MRPRLLAASLAIVMEVFKVQDGMIRHIFAFLRGNGQPDSGWPDVPAK